MPPVERIAQRAPHPLAFEDVGRLEDAGIDHGGQPEQFRDGSRGLSCTLERRRNQRADRTSLRLEVLGGRAGHTATVVAQMEAGKPPVEHAVGVMDLPVSHEMEAGSRHPFSLREGVLCRA